jgi:hypothetical protein
MAGNQYERLNQAQRDEIVRRALAGEKLVALGREFGISPTYAGLLKAKAVDPTRFAKEAVYSAEWNAENGKQRLSNEQREELTRRVLAGEKCMPLAEEFKVSRAYVSLLKNQALDPERFTNEEKLTKKLTAAEIAKFTEVLTSTTPTDHDFYPHSERWNMDYGARLAEKLFKKKPSVRALTELVKPHMPKRSEFKFTRPQPPKPHHISQISAEFANDPDFVAYYLSPICQQIAQREYELAVADWDARFADSEEREMAAEAKMAAPSKGNFQIAQPGKRMGKHAKGKGSPFTPPKRKKRR